jgi:hypothetical protein
VEVAGNELLKINGVMSVWNGDQGHGAAGRLRGEDAIKNGAEQGETEGLKQSDKRKEHNAGEQLEPVRPDVPQQANQSAHGLLFD